MPSPSTLYDVFSANLALYRNNRGGLFMCPLCKCKFARNALDGGDLNRAHTVPQSMGGTHWTLACKDCNGRIGSEIESCAKHNDDCGKALSGNSNETVRAQVWFRNEQGAAIGPLQGDMGARDCDGELRPHVQVKRKGSHLKAWELFSDIESGEVPTGQWNAEVLPPAMKSAKRANLAYVHAAYLHMFHQFGYEWVLTPAAELVRKQIASPAEPIIVPLAPRLSGPHIPDDGLTLLLATEPAEFRSFLVVLPELGWPERQGVWMPIFGSPYSQPPRARTKLSAIKVPDHHEFLHLPESRYQGYHFVLEHLGKKR